MAAIATVSTPAFADYYVVQRPDHKCEVVEKRPADTTILQVGPLAFSTRDEAERQLKVVCHDSYSDDNDRVIIERH
jgi:hypothetical protein